MLSSLALCQGRTKLVRGQLEVVGRPLDVRGHDLAPRAVDIKVIQVLLTYFVQIITNEIY